MQFISEVKVFCPNYVLIILKSECDKSSDDVFASLTVVDRPAAIIPSSKFIYLQADDVNALFCFGTIYK